MKKWVTFSLFIFVTLVFCLWQVTRVEKSSQELVTEVFSAAGIEIGGTNPWDITVHNEQFYSRIIAEGSLGLGETYMEKMWDCPAIDQFVYRLLTSDAAAHGKKHLIRIAWVVLKAKVLNLQNRLRSKEVIEMHYNLGNDLFSKMLGSSMAYSCGYWQGANNLTQAQNNKYDLICRKLKLEPGMTLLDIGCGFGGLAHYAATNYKVKVVGITLSENQASYARNLCEGLPVDIQVKDYRDFSGMFDRIVSVGMFEHVGPKNYDEYMEVSYRCLKSGGLFLLHTIGGNESGVHGDPWLSKYIFPGGILPSIVEIGKASEGVFIMEDWHNFGLDYDKTLLAWHANFLKSWPSLSSEYSEIFYRMWNYYLLCCAGAFRARETQLWQIVFSKDRLNHEYTREI